MMLIPSWGPLTEEQFYTAHKMAMKAIAEQGSIDWSGTFAATDPSTLIATIAMAILNVLCPVSAPFDPLIEPAVELIIKLLMGSLTADMKTFGGGPTAYSARVQQLAQEAEQA
jgi:hypothetical protein